MPTIAAGPIDLVPTTRTMMARRLVEDDFVLGCVLREGEAPVRFPPSWPGDALDLFPEALAAMPEGDETVEGSWIAVSVDGHVVVGGIGVKGPPDDAGVQEIGYGFGAEHRGRGYATAAVRALVDHLLSAGVTAVTAETATWNLASARVLEKAGFESAGSGWSEEDGPLRLWRRGRR